MNEEKLVELLKEHFPTREDHNVLLREVREGFADVKTHFKIVDEKLDDLKASSNALDRILEKHPIPRIERLEQHVGLPPFVPVLAEE